MRNQQRKDRPQPRCKRGGASGGGGGGGSTGRTNVRDAPDTMAEGKTLKAEMDLMDVFDDIADIAPTMMASKANELIRKALNLGPNQQIPENVTAIQAATIMRQIAFTSKFNLRDSDFKHYII